MIPTLFGLLLCSSGSAQTPGATEQEILKLEQILDDAFLKKDRATYERLLADDYLYIHSNGTMTNRMQEIAETMSASPALPKVTSADHV
jgi:hypothetical protein